MTPKRTEKTMSRTNLATLVAHCPDRIGHVAAISSWIHERGGNILELDQHVDQSTERFFIRIVWDLTDFALTPEPLRAAFDQDLATPMDMTWTLSLTQRPVRIALFVSKLGHCLWDLLARQLAGEWNAEIPIVISNHETHRDTVEKMGYRFEHIPVTAETKQDAEAQQLALLRENDIDIIVLARYMQVLSESFVAHYPNRVINIHHSFLPAFAGAKPYHRAHERGVKIIGATAHYVTPDLDEGPIIDQETTRVSHRDAVGDLIRTGRDLEKIVLSRAVFLHLNRRIAVFHNRTVVFT
jgi:formyltetrahydrofolate deformylase